jgi:hypothetical protein
MLMDMTESGRLHEVKDLEYREEFDLKWNQLTLGQRDGIDNHVSSILNDLVNSPDANWGSITNASIEGGKASPETGIRGDWSGTPFEPIFDLFGDETEAGKFFGKVWKKAIIERKDEEWIGYRSNAISRPTFPNRGITLQGKTYFLKAKH